MIDVEYEMLASSRRRREGQWALRKLNPEGDERAVRGCTRPTDLRSSRAIIHSDVGSRGIGVAQLLHNGLAIPASARCTMWGVSLTPN